MMPFFLIPAGTSGQVGVHPQLLPSGHQPAPGCQPEGIRGQRWAPLLLLLPDAWLLDSPPSDLQGCCTGQAGASEQP